MKRTISGILGLLPSDQFQVIIVALWEPLSKLLISSMMTRRTLLSLELENWINLKRQKPQCSLSSLLMNGMHPASSTVYKLSPIPVLPPVHFSPMVSPITIGFHLKIRWQASHSIALSLTSVIPSRSLRFSTGAASPSNEGAASMVQFEDFVEKDWSFLDCDDTGDAMRKIDRIISAGNVKETSKVLISIGTEAFVDRLVDLSPCEQLLVVHDSLFTLACIKEKYDKVGCWQGAVIDVPVKWTPFDVVYLYFLPALPFQLDQLLAALAKNCLPGARVVMSHTKGRQAVEEQRQQHPNVVVSNFPDKITLESIAADHAFQVVEFVDEPGFFLAVLRVGEERVR